MTLRTGDIFSGWGGFSEGAEAAGATTVFGANHWELACRVFGMNHPNALVLQQDLSEADWSKFPEVDVLVGGPSCQGFTRARGKERKHHDSLRNHMWAVVNAAESMGPEVMVIENVPEVQDWACFPAWTHALNCLGYATESHVIDAADYGVPQHRVRWFCVASRSNAPMGLARHLDALKAGHVNVRDFIDWDYERWSAVDKPGRSPKLLAQVERGRRELGTDRFLVPYYGSGSGLTGRSLDRPIGTLVAQDIWAVVDGARMRMLQPHEAASIMGFPADFKMAGTRRERMRGLGNAVCPPVATALVESINQAARMAA